MKILKFTAKAIKKTATIAVLYGISKNKKATKITELYLLHKISKNTKK